MPQFVAAPHPESDEEAESKERKLEKGVNKWGEGRTGVRAKRQIQRHEETANGNGKK